MAKYIDLNTIRFQLYQVHDLEALMQTEHFGDYDRQSIDIFLDSVMDFSEQELYPIFREMDEQPAHYKDGEIVVHPQLESILQKAGQLGLSNATFDYEDGGLQIPYAVYSSAFAIMEAANNHVPGYLGLTVGAADLILTFGDEALKSIYSPPMQTAKWMGTMCLTEPQAGSSLSDVTTTAYPTGEGYFKIKGQKIFISGGDHGYAENFVHMVLARIEGAPPGTKGISLFVVPKLRPDGKGNLEANDVITAGDFQKMGQKGYCTTHLVFGENDNCHGWLVGKPNNGLRYMFQMMNRARIDVGRGAMAICHAAYHASLQYANERPQGRRLTNSGKKDVSKEQTLIINHPDVRRMLLHQKAVAEGSLSLILQASMYHDQERVATTEEEKEKYHLLLELMTPVAKTYPSEAGKSAVSNGLQILGGYGFCSEFVLQQYLRDIRIFSIYEGTTGIQSLDLLGRKLTIKGGKAVHLITEQIVTTIESAATIEELKPYAEQLSGALSLNQEVIQFLMGFAQKGEYERFLSDATVFMEFFGTIIVGWQWLKIAVAAKHVLLTGKMEYGPDFYESKIHTMKFFYKYEMLKLSGWAQILTSEEVLTLPLREEVLS